MPARRAPTRGRPHNKESKIKNIIKTIILTCSILFLTHCSGESLLGDDILNGDTSGPTGELNVVAVHHGQNETAIVADGDGHKSFTTDLGYTIDLEEAVVNWSSLTLISSGADPECLGGNDQEIALNQFEDFLEEDLVEAPLKSTLVPIAAYCSYEILLAPTPLAAIKFHAGESHAGSEGIEVTLHLAGAWTKGVDSGTFSIESTDPVAISANFDHPFHFHDGETEKELTFGTQYDGLLNGIDFVSVPSAADQLSQVEANLTDAVEQHLAAH